MDTPLEAWRPVPEFPTYEVSDLGRVRRIVPFKFGSTPAMRAAGYVLTPHPQGWGYLQVMLYRNHRAYPHVVHRLVAFAFLPSPRAEQTDVNHRDGVKTHNQAENLEWVTQSENQRHAARLGLAYAGERNGRAKLSADDVRRIREELTHSTGIRGWASLKHPAQRQYTLAAIAHRYGVSPSAIAWIRRRQHWTSVP